MLERACRVKPSGPRCAHGVVSETEVSAIDRRKRMPHHLPSAAYRLNWNPDRPDTADDVSQQDVDACAKRGHVTLTWRCGNARIRAGQPLLLLRTGKGPRGIIGAGKATGAPEPIEGDALSQIVSIKFDVLSLLPLVPAEALAAPPLDAVKWSSQAAAARLTPEQLDAVENLLAPFRVPRPFALPDEVTSAPTYAEGAVRTITINAYERSQAGRKACLDAWGTTCVVCDLDFGKRFGRTFAGLIHVHHLVPLSSIKRGYHLDPVRDLRPVCPNCHAMLHRREPPFTIEEGRGWFTR